MTKQLEKTVQQILADELDRQLEENPIDLPTPEEFRKMAYDRLASKEQFTKEMREEIANRKPSFEEFVKAVEEDQKADL